MHAVQVERLKPGSLVASDDHQNRHILAGYVTKNRPYAERWIMPSPVAVVYQERGHFTSRQVGQAFWRAPW